MVASAIHIFDRTFRVGLDQTDSHLKVILFLMKDSIVHDAKLDRRRIRKMSSVEDQLLRRRQGRSHQHAGNKCNGAHFVLPRTEEKTIISCIDIRIDFLFR